MNTELKPKQTEIKKRINVIKGFVIAGFFLEGCAAASPPVSNPQEKSATPPTTLVTPTLEFPSPVAHVTAQPENTSTPPPTETPPPTATETPKNTSELLANLTPEQVKTEYRGLTLGVGGNQTEVNLTPAQEKDRLKQASNLLLHLSEWTKEGYFPNIQLGPDGQLTGFNLVVWPTANKYDGTVVVAAQLQAPGSDLDQAFVSTASAGYKETPQVAPLSDPEKPPLILTQNAWQKLGMAQSDGGSVEFAGATFTWVGPGKDGKPTIKGLVDPITNEWLLFDLPTTKEELTWKSLPDGSRPDLALSQSQLLKAGIPQEIIDKYHNLGRAITWVAPGVLTGKVPPEQGILVNQPDFLWTSNHNPAEPGAALGFNELYNIPLVMGQAVGVIERVVKKPQGPGYYIITMNPDDGKKTVSTILQPPLYKEENLQGGTTIAGVGIDIQDGTQYNLSLFSQRGGLTNEAIITQVLTPGRVVIVSRPPRWESEDYRDENGAMPAGFVLIFDTQANLLQESFQKTH